MNNRCSSGSLPVALECLLKPSLTFMQARDSRR
nr:MAG TPA: hypothetical protein [Caudoviricetes sp.]